VTLTSQAASALRGEIQLIPRLLSCGLPAGVDERVSAPSPQFPLPSPAVAAPPMPVRPSHWWIIVKVMLFRGAAAYSDPLEVIVT